jgi:hypothetical protein
MEYGPKQTPDPVSRGHIAFDTPLDVIMHPQVEMYLGTHARGLDAAACSYYIVMKGSKYPLR